MLLEALIQEHNVALVVTFVNYCEEIKTTEPLFISFSIVGNPKVPLSFKFETLLSFENKGLDCASFDCASESHIFSKGKGWADVSKRSLYCLWQWYCRSSTLNLFHEDIDSVQEINLLMEDIVLRSLDARPCRLMEETVLRSLEAGPFRLVEDTVLRSLEAGPLRLVEDTFLRSLLFSVRPLCIIARCR